MEEKVACEQGSMPGSKPVVKADPTRLRIVFALLLGFVLATSGVLFGVSEASGARYTVSQCGWYVGHDAAWADSSANRFVRSSWCVAPPGSNSFDGVHLTSQTRPGSKAIGGTKFSRWRWQAPRGTTIVNVNAKRWQILRDGFQHRIGAVTQNGGFTPMLKLVTTDTAQRDFSRKFPPATVAFESRLLCARPSSRHCRTSNRSLAGLRSLTFALEDPLAPIASIGGPLVKDAWLRGAQALTFSSRDQGSGLRYAETMIDGSLRGRTQHACARVSVGGQMRGSKMQPCASTATGSQTVATTSLSDGPHQLRHCASDFAGNRGCTATQTIRTDNSPPAAPRELTAIGGSEWRRSNGFELGWRIPDQGVAAPVTGSRYRLTGDGFDTGISSGPADRLGPLELPRPGVFRARVWLVDAAGNETESNGADTLLRFDDVPPSAYFQQPAAARPEIVRVPVSDAHSGPATGSISIRNETGGEWQKLPTAIGGEGASRVLTARFPSEDLARGTWHLRARVLDRAGNETVTDRRGNGSVMTLQAPRKRDTTLRARLVGRHGGGSALRIGYRNRARVTGRLSAAGSGGLAGQPVRITEIPAAGSRQRTLTRTVSTGRDGIFRLALRRGTSRRVTVSYAGTDRHARASAGPFNLKVRGGLVLRVRPRRLKTGQRLRFSGRVGAKLARRPARGSLVALQYLEQASGLWRPVLVTRANRRGQFRAKYRFRYITGTARIRLRAVLLPAPGFPYTGSTSPVVTIRVRG